MLHSAACGARVARSPHDPQSLAGSHNARSVVMDIASITVVWAAGAAVFFRAQLTSGFGRVMGDNGDARLIVYLCEHWYLLFRGEGAWRSPAFFYPVKGLLGWSDSFFLYEVFYTPLRLVGCDPFLAFQLTLVLLSAVGFASFVLLARHAFGAPRAIALFGGLVFTFSNTLSLHVSSPQLLGIYFVPLILVVGLWSWRARPEHPGRSILLGAAVGLAWGLLFYTTYYVAWFALLGAGVLLLVAVVGGRRSFVAGALGALRVRGKVLAAVLAGFVVGIVPFAVTYLPVLSQTGSLKYRQALAYAPRWQDLVDVGPGNVVWSGLVHRIVSSAVLAPYEVTFGVTPLLLALAVVGGILGAWRLRAGPHAPPQVARGAVALAATAIVLCVLPVRTAEGSLWAVVWHIPGATAIRAVDRLEVVTGLAVALAVVAAATELSAGFAAPRLILRGRSGAGRAAAGVLLVLAVVEQLNTTQKSLISRPAQLALLRSASPPPSVCRSFFVVDGARPASRYYVYQIDAMLISQKLAIPTVNGYTAHNPAGWRLDYLGRPHYRLDVAAWARVKGVREGLCQLDLATMAWDAHPGLPPR